MPKYKVLLNAKAFVYQSRLIDAVSQQQAIEIAKTTSGDYRWHYECLDDAGIEAHANELKPLS